MDSISLFIAISCFIVGIAIHHLQSRRRIKEYQLWESQLISNQVKISLNAAQKVIANEMSLELLENQAWELALKYGCDFETACRIRDKNMSPPSIPSSNGAYPFVFKPVKDSSHHFHIYEMVNEPETCINGSNTHTWAYKSAENANISQVVFAGHANGPVCKQISSLIYNTYLGMENVGNSLLVPGACLLQESVDVSNLIITFPPPLSLNPYSQTPPPLNEFLGNLQPFQQDTGLSRIQPINTGAYWLSDQKILQTITEYQDTTTPILLKTVANRPNSKARFFPFLTLGVKNPSPVSFELPLSLFETDDFRYLKEIHHQALVLEMTADAQRRKQIYQEWLKRDEENYENYGRYYKRLSDEEKNAQSVRISHSRDFVNALETKTSPRQEIYQSPREQYENTMPAIIRLDREWIGKMDEMIGNLRSRDRIRDHRLAEVNLAVLVDSFLRGWPPVFLGGDKDSEGQKRYLSWCEEKRELAWRAIHRRLHVQGIRIEPFLEENTVFQIQLVNDRVLRLTPLHLTTDQDVLIYLSPEYGVSYYINKWSRRKLSETNITNNWQEAYRHYQRAERYLDMLEEYNSLPDESNLIRQAVELLQLALRTHPAIVQVIWNGWWQRFGKDTSVDFENFKELAKGFRAYFDGDYKQSRDYLNRFIHIYPNTLPDPYVLVAIQELEEKENSPSLMIEHRDKATEHNAILEKIKAIEGFIKSNEPLLAKVREGRISDSWEMQEKLVAINQKVAEHAEFIKKITRLREEINELERKLDKNKQTIWNNLKSDPNAYFEKAKSLSPEYVEKILTEQKFAFSDVYAFRFHALIEILHGDEYIIVANRLNGISFQLGHNKIAPPELTSEIDECLSDITYLQHDDLKDIHDFREKLTNLLPESGRVDAIVREMILRKEIDQIVTTFFQKGVSMYEQSAHLLPEFLQPICRLTELYALHRLQYRKSWQSMCNRKLPLRNTLLSTEFVVLSYKKQMLETVWFDSHRDVIQGIDKDGDSLDLIQVNNLKVEDREHLIRQINNPQFRVTPIGLNSAEKILNTPIEPSPISRRWSKALLEMESWLTRSIAYLGILPIPSNEPVRDGLLALFEGKPRLDGIDLDTNRILSEFFQEIGVPEQEVSVVEVNLSDESIPATVA